MSLTSSYILTIRRHTLHSGPVSLSLPAFKIENGEDFQDGEYTLDANIFECISCLERRTGIIALVGARDDIKAYMYRCRGIDQKTA